MPIYTMYCSECDETIDMLMSYNTLSSEVHLCSKCNTQLLNQLAPSEFKLLGAGFYNPSKTAFD